MDNSLFNLLSLAAFGLLVFVTLGILYLTFAEWRDRRRIQQEQRGRRK
ncbi:MAG: hypothetical protein AAF329_15160 [Cyanobacteria bacterium P01_A01_bin.17]